MDSLYHWISKTCFKKNISKTWVQNSNFLIVNNFAKKIKLTHIYLEKEKSESIFIWILYSSSSPLTKLLDAWRPKISSLFISQTWETRSTARAHFSVGYSCFSSSSSAYSSFTFSTYAPTAAAARTSTAIPTRRRRGLIPPPSAACPASRTAQPTRSRAQEPSAPFVWAYFRKVTSWRFCPSAAMDFTRTVSISGSRLARVAPCVERVSTQSTRWVASSTRRSLDFVLNIVGVFLHKPNLPQFCCILIEWELGLFLITVLRCQLL